MPALGGSLFYPSVIFDPVMRGQMPNFRPPFIPIRRWETSKLTYNKCFHEESRRIVWRNFPKYFGMFREVSHQIVISFNFWWPHILVILQLSGNFLSSDYSSCRVAAVKVNDFVFSYYPAYLAAGDIFRILTASQSPAWGTLLNWNGTLRGLYRTPWAWYRLHTFLLD